MNIAHLRYFNKLAELKSYTHAAKALYITQPALSAAIKNLEHEIGFSLIRKEGRGIELTPEGRNFYCHVRRALHEIDEGIAEGRLDTEKAPGTVYLGIESPDQIRHLASVIKEFREEVFDGTRFEIVRGTTHSLLERVAASEIQIAFVEPVHESDTFEFVRAIPYQIRACVARSSIFASRKSLDYFDLQQSNLITYQDSVAAGRYVLAWLSKTGLRAVAGFEDEETLRSMVYANPDSIALIVTPYNWSETSAELASIPVESSTEPFYSYAAIRKDTTKNSTVRRFFTYLEEKALRYR